MRVSNQQLARVVIADLEAGKDSSQVAASLAAYLVAERRTKDADAVIREIGRVLRSEGQIELNITSVRGINDDLKQAISELFKGNAKNIIINEERNPAVLGGVLVESDEQRLDLTVRRQIQRLKGMSV